MPFKESVKFLNKIEKSEIKYLYDFIIYLYNVLV